MKLFISNVALTVLEINIHPHHKFEKTFQSLLGGKKYGTAGYFYWNKMNPDGSVTRIRLSEDGTPSLVFMDVNRPQVLEWKKAVVWRMMTK
jgi:hypothetical protein